MLSLNWVKNLTILLTSLENLNKLKKLIKQCSFIKRCHFSKQLTFIAKTLFLRPFLPLIDTFIHYGNFGHSEHKFKTLQLNGLLKSPLFLLCLTSLLLCHRNIVYFSRLCFIQRGMVYTRASYPIIAQKHFVFVSDIRSYNYNGTNWSQ